MDFAEAMKQLETDNPELHKVVQGKVTSVSEEAKGYRKKNSTNNEILEAIVSQLGVEDVKRVPEVVETKNAELNALIKQQEQTQTSLDEIKTKFEESEKLLAKGSIKEELKGKLKGFKNPERLADLLVDKTKKGETGLLIGDKFADDYIKDLGVEDPYLLNKELPASTTTETTDTTNTDTKTTFTEAEIAAMDDETFDKNAEAILAQEEI
jgi:hypothetical protein